MKVPTWLPDSLQRKLRTIYYRGDAFHCPFCGFKGRALSPIGFDLPVLVEKQVSGAGRRNAGCFNCGIIDRERLVHVYLRDVLHIYDRLPSSRILHIAPDEHITGFLSRSNVLEYVCGDKFTEGYVYPKHVVDLDIQHLPFSSDHFDLVICNHVLEHVPDDAGAMRELLRVLKPGGHAVLQVPLSANMPTTFEDPAIVDPKERERLYGQFDHVRLYGQDYGDRLRAAGFTVERLQLARRKEFERYGLNPAEDLFVGVKPS
ncbi:MAG TPA: methyltransferase domain-containing protein [Flavobacteriales bacterium]|nr:methyltransferase domain-containing protein [Flavobacteriales bacterium]